MTLAIDIVQPATMDKSTSCVGDGLDNGTTFIGSRDMLTAFYFSIALFITSSVIFCVVRIHWPKLYAMKKVSCGPSRTLPKTYKGWLCALKSTGDRSEACDTRLPALPNSYLSWIPALWLIEEQQVIDFVGLDAFVFLTFHKFGIKFLASLTLISGTILTPINSVWVGLPPPWPHQDPQSLPSDKTFLWAYTVFTWIITFMLLFEIIHTTERIASVRQKFMKGQSSVAHRTITLSKLPQDMRSEDKIRKFVQSLGFGQVHTVTLCRNWSSLGTLITYRESLLTKLEEAWSVNNVPRRSHMGLSRLNPLNSSRPRVNLRYGPWKLRTQAADAIEYYTERLRKLDEDIAKARAATYESTSTAFVTMNDRSACQMLVLMGRTLVDFEQRSPVFSSAPEPSDIIWPSLYMTRNQRIARHWIFLAIVSSITIIWTVPVAILAALINICLIDRISPEFGRFIRSNDWLRAFVQASVPALIVSVVGMFNPYLYAALAQQAGHTRKSSMQLWLISQNFTFLFWNVFIVFCLFGTASGIVQMLLRSVKDTTAIATQLAKSLTKLGILYTNFLLFQGIGLLPLRQLMVGNVVSYVCARIGAKTPDHFVKLIDAPTFDYAFYLPTSILVFVLCLTYSVFPAGFMVLLFGTLYFILGHIVYKYQLLYAMKQPQETSGRAWPLIVRRLLVGLVFFQVAVIGVILANEAYVAAILIVPLIAVVAWFNLRFTHEYAMWFTNVTLQGPADPEHQVAENGRRYMPASMTTSFVPQQNDGSDHEENSVGRHETV